MMTNDSAYSAYRTIVILQSSRMDCLANLGGVTMAGIVSDFSFPTG